MRCAYCPAEATVYLDAEIAPPCCDAAACVRASGDAWEAVERHRDALAGRLSDRQLRAAEAQASEREATPEPWVLW